MNPQPVFLYAEDDANSREIMQVLLVDVLGHRQVTLWPDTTNFLERLEVLDPMPDVIFLDIQIDPHDGYEVLRMIRNDPRYDRVRIVALTASVTVSDVSRVKAAGFDALLGKPIKQRVFPTFLKQVLSGANVWNVT